ncbi:MAG: hypothetical protein DYG89_23105 [Caldilinea sp. CFX5]|nr:hypothetical protein [Caldilinea sp. CFX5]
MTIRNLFLATRLFLGLFLCSFACLFWQPVQAQQAPNSTAADNPSAILPDAAAHVPRSPAALGAPGLNFHYVQQFGKTATGYIEDTNHFYEVWGIASDGANLWIADAWGNRALKFDSNGGFLQQIGKASFREAVGTSLDYLSDIGVDRNGNIWIVDGSATHVVKFNANGEKIGELGKAWESGADNAHFYSPIGIAFDQAGNIYISDSGLWGEYGNHRIQIFDSTGAYLATIGETGVAGSDNNHLRSPRRIAIAGSHLYIADSGNHRVQIFDITTPTATTYVATLGVTGEPADNNTHFNSPEGVGVDANFIYVADSQNHRVQIFQRTTRSYVGTFGTRGTGTNQFDYPTDVAIDSAGRIYVADAWNRRVQQFSNGHYLRTYGTTDVPYLTDGNHYNAPTGVALARDGSMYIVEDRGSRLVKLNANGHLQWSVGTPGESGDDNQHFNGPYDVAVDNDDRVYVVDTWNHRVQIFADNGSYVATLGNGQGSGNAQLSAPRGLAIGKDGTIFVADTENDRVQIYNANRSYLRTLGQTGVSGSDNNHFNYPEDVAVDASGNIYVADHYNHRIQVFASSGAYLRTIGVSGECGRDFEHLCDPIGVAVDSEGRTYVADGWGWRVQVFDKNGAYLTTISQRDSNHPQMDGLTLDSDGDLYLVEYLNHRILQYALGSPAGWTQTNLNGFGHPQTRGIMSLTTARGMLYASTSGWDGTGARRLMRSNDGRNWSEAIGRSAGSVYNYEFTKLAEFKGNLYVGTSHFNWDKQQTEGGELWRSADGLSWTAVVTGGFGIADNGIVDSLLVFNDHLYAATYPLSNTRGFDLWRSSTGDLLDWTRVITNGFGDPKNWTLTTLEVFSNTLYAGSANETTGGELWRSQDGNAWTQIYLDGFGTAQNDIVGSLEVFRGQLYAGLRNRTAGGEIWRSADGSQWTRVVSGGLGNVKNGRPYNLTSYAGHLYVTFGNEEEGLGVWRSADGVNWQLISAGGWGDSNNTFPAPDRAATVFGGQLYVGTWNEANGGELWRYTADSVTLTIANSALAHTLVYTDAQGDLTQINLPAGAVTGTIELLYTPIVPAAPPSGFAFGNSAFSLTAYRDNLLQSGFTFLQPVLVTIAYRDADVAGMAEDELRLLWYNPQTQSWEEAACGTYDHQPAQNRLTVPICHLSQFGLFGERQALYLPVVRR